jgi:hypothetical protein
LRGLTPATDIKQAKLLDQLAEVVGRGHGQTRLFELDFFSNIFCKTVTVYTVQELPANIA